MQLLQGQILNNRYRIVKLLGQGGFGAVYRAWDMNMECPRAIKENLNTSPEAERQFKLEAKILGELAHPNLPHVIDHFILPGQGQYLVMDFVEGEDLEKMLTRNGGPLPEQRVISWIVQVCDALDYLHSRIPPIIHRDIKPANIKITPQGRAMLVDFGIAKIYDPQKRTTIGARAVTPGYSPNEQYGKGGRTDARTDIYALGATLYHLLTGQEPVETPERILGTPLPLLRQLNPVISLDVETAVMKAMKILPHNRWQSAKEFKEALRLQQSIQSQRPSVSLRSQAMGKTTAVLSSHCMSRILNALRLRAEWILGSILVILVVVVIGLLFLSRNENSAPISNTEGVVVLLSETTDLQRTNPAPSLSATIEMASLPNPSPSFPATTEVVETATETTPQSPTIIRSELGTSTALHATLTANAVLYVGTLTARGGLPPVAPTTETPPAPSVLMEDFTDEHGVHMKLIPAGEFQMGVNANQAVENCKVICPDCSCELIDFTNAEPKHTVYLDSFYMDIYEVTNAMYAFCVKVGACTEPLETRSDTREAYYGNTFYDHYPVIYVSWEQAKGYCEWRGGRLPTEAEWEKAARGGLEGRLYPWGDQEPDCSLANFGGEKGCEGDTVEVGSYPANGYGLFDVAGNVWEWVMDWYSEDYYANSPSENPIGSSSGQHHCLRGGSFAYYGYVLYVSLRYRFDPSNNYHQFGFRCSRSP